MIKKFIKNKFLNEKPTQSIAAAAFIITMAGIVSNLLGLLRDRSLAATFGAGDTLDVYYAAFRIPDLIYNLLIVGALSAAFIPVFTGLMSKEKKDEAWQLANDMMNLAIIFIVCFSILFAIFAPWIMKFITPGFPPEKMAQVVLFTRIMFLSPLFLGISGIMGGVLTSMKRFLIYSIAPLLYNLGIIFGIFVLTRFFGPIGLAWGVVFGAFMHMSLQYLTVRNLGYAHHWSGLQSLKNNNVRRILKLMTPRMAGIAVNQLNSIVSTIFASTLVAGSLSIFTFATNLQSVPFYVFGISFSIAAFPALSAYAARDEMDKFVRVFSETFRQIMFFIIPISVFMIILRAQIVRVTLGAGKFDWNDTILTFQCMGILVVGLLAQSAVQILVRSFYALQDTKTPFFVAVFQEIIYIISLVFLIHHVQVLGLAIAVTIASTVQMLLLFFLLRARFNGLDDKNMLKSLVKISLASLVAGIVVQLIKNTTASITDLDRFIDVFMQLSASSLAGVAVFAGACYLMKLEEFMTFKNSLTKKLFKNKQAVLITEGTEEVSGM